MDRRSFLKTSSIVAGTAAAANSAGQALAGQELSAPAINHGCARLRVAVSWPDTTPGISDAVTRLGQGIEQSFDGRVGLDLMPSSETRPRGSCFDVVARGDADIYLSRENFHFGDVPMLGLFDSLPGGMKAAEFNSWLAFGGGQSLWDELVADHNVKPFAFGNTAGRGGTWSRARLGSLDELKRKKIVVPGLSGTVLATLGADVQNDLTGWDLANAARDSDVVEGLSPYSDWAFGLPQNFKNYYVPGINAGGNFFSIGINRTVWQRFSAGEQAVLGAVIASQGAKLSHEFVANEAMALGALSQRHKLTIETSDHLLESRPFIAAIDGRLEELAGKNSLTRRLYDSYRGFEKIVDSSKSRPLGLV